MAKLFKSRTVWTIILMFLIGGTEALGGLIPGDFQTFVLGLLGAMATYFKLNPSQDYGGGRS
jgi:hypothetical protein